MVDAPPDPGSAEALRRAGAILRPYEGIAPRLAPGAWVAPGAVLVGDVALGPGASVWYGCVLRADVHRIRIGARTNVQDGAVLHGTRDRFAAELGEEVTVGHRAVVHGARVGDGALVGIGAVLLDGAEIGEEALVAAGAVVTPGTRIPPGVLARGTPARVARELSAEERAAQREQARAYVDTAARHAAAGRSRGAGA